jgi:nucleotide-binding universal stress UspA family protein
MKKILIPTDFSPCANNALNFAEHLAKIIPVEISVFHSFEVKGTSYTNYVGVNKEFNQFQLGEAEAKLTGLKKKIKAESGIDINIFVSEFELHKAILSATDDLQIDFIIMGTLGASGIREVFMGSRTSRVIGESKVPVIAVPDEYIWKKPAKILFTTHHFEKDPAVLDVIFELADLLMAKVEVAVFTDKEDKAINAAASEKQLIEFKAMLKEKYFEKELPATHLYGKDLLDSLEEFIQDHHIDLLVMAAHQKGFWKRLFNPMITKKVSYHSHIPLLAIPVKEEE